MRDPTRPPPPSPARRGLLAGGLALVVVGVGVLAWVLAVAAGLVGGDDPVMDDTPRTLDLEGAASSSGGTRPTVAYRLEPADGPPRTVRLEVAADPAARARGLMGRRQVPEGTGMVFLYPADVREAFWMKNTLVPLSIAFVAADGRVVSVAEMTPCQADPCPTYAPAGPYRYAVELAAGAFGAARVGPGAKVAPVDPSGLPDPS
ncbi:MAG TPA: DUF192 domain-containing protein [Actinomycetota bacterium]|jgi:uncharacterized membrane protein (UPF0127 family)